MRRIKYIGLVQDKFAPFELRRMVEREFGAETEVFDVKDLPKEGRPEMSFAYLVQSFKLFGEGLVTAATGAWGMLQWSVVCIVEGFRLLWKGGVGREVKKEVQKKSEKKEAKR